MKQFKIFSLAAALIRTCESMLVCYHQCSVEDASCKPILVEKNHVVFLIHSCVKRLLDNLKPIVPGRDALVFTKAENELWRVEIEADGVESYLFARLLFSAIEFSNMTSHFDLTKINCQIIQTHTQEAILRAIGENDIIFTIEATYNNTEYVYSINVPVDENGTTMTFSNKNPDILCRRIGLYIKDNLRAKNPSES